MYNINCIQSMRKKPCQRISQVKLLMLLTIIKSEMISPFILWCLVLKNMPGNISDMSFRTLGNTRNRYPVILYSNYSEPLMCALCSQLNCIYIVFLAILSCVLAMKVEIFLFLTCGIKVNSKNHIGLAQW